MDLVRPWAAALVLWVVGAIAGRRITISFASLETLQSVWGTLSWVMPTKFLLFLLITLVASWLYTRVPNQLPLRRLIAVLGIPVLVLMLETVQLFLSSDPNLLYWSMRELATVAGALSGWALGIRIFQ
ncbi:hypothetical protein [Nocardiopsis rhodophaea]|uniref:hypothetical protein n=1 Tax=Nocardiopsis rhodophaea TaxID=280238 RepID=UPI0031D341DC